MIRKHGNFEPVQQRADETRTRILEAALAVFSQRGYARANTKNIAAEAGVSTGSVYRYFKDKKTIFIEVINMLQGQMSLDIFTKTHFGLEENKDLPKFFRMIGKYAVQSHRKNRKFFREVIALEATDPDVAAIAKERDRKIRAQLYNLLQSISDKIKPEDLEAASELVHLVVEEVSHQAVIFDSDVGEERLVNQMSTMLESYLFGQTFPS